MTQLLLSLSCLHSILLRVCATQLFIRQTTYLAFCSADKLDAFIIPRCSQISPTWAVCKSTHWQTESGRYTVEGAIWKLVDLHTQGLTLYALARNTCQI